MNRKLLFRGKRKDNNEWIYGYYVKVEHFLGLKYLHYIVDEKQNYVEIIPETVSQYTGLKDKNGKKIFEGDIVKVKSYHYYQDKEYLKGKIIFKDGSVKIKIKCGKKAKKDDEE